MRRWGASRISSSAASWVVVGGLALLQIVAFGMPFGQWVDALSKGLLAAMLAVGMALVYRANRVVNFAQADLGTVPAAFATAFIMFWGWPYLLGLGAGLLLAVVLGVAVELAFIRRFRTAPRLVVTVATLGITQLLVVLGILVPRWWGRNLAGERPDPPLDWKFTPSFQVRFWEADGRGLILNAHHLIALVVAPAAMLGVAWFLDRSRLGIAIRASAERTDRAAMLGIPVGRLHTVVWAISAALSFLALFIRSGMQGVPYGVAGSLSTLLLALGALVIGRMENLPTVASAAVVLTLLEFGVRNRYDDAPGVAYAVMAAAIFLALLLQRRSGSRRDTDATSSWRGAEEIRPLPEHLRNHGWVPTVRVVLLGLVTMVVLLAPRLFGVGVITKATALIAFGIIGMSLVVLTGWSGQISFGQMALVAIGAAVGATLTTRWQVDLTLTLLAGGLAGGAAALVVGLPALRLRGLYLAVTTFALALGTEYWLLNGRFFGWFPRPSTGIDRLPLFGRLGVRSTNAFYWYSLAVLGLVYLGLQGIRRSRTGRAILAVRENERAAQSFSIGAVRAKLTAFVISGFVAGLAGALLVHGQRAFDVQNFGAGDSFDVFVAAVIGGMGSLGGALLGALYLRGTRWFINDQAWQLLGTGFGVLLVLLVLPGGLGSLWVKLRDVVVRLLTGQRVDGPPPEEAAA